MYGKKHSPEALEKITQARTGTKWMHNGEEQKAVPNDQIKDYEQKGWSLGRLKIKGRRWINDGNGNCRCISQKDVLKYTYLGWQVGRN